MSDILGTVSDVAGTISEDTSSYSSPSSYYAQPAAPPTTTSGLSATTLLLGLVAIGGVAYLLTRKR